jgi:hypothetical protein
VHIDAAAWEDDRANFSVRIEHVQHHIAKLWRAAAMHAVHDGRMHDISVLLPITHALSI